MNPHDSIQYLKKNEYVTFCSLVADHYFFHLFKNTHLLFLMQFYTEEIYFLWAIFCKNAILIW